MGREIRRVPMGFSWPLGKPWGGFINPFYRQCVDCPACDGTGYSPAYKRLTDMWYGNAPFEPANRDSVPLTVDHPAVRSLAERNCRDRTWDHHQTTSAIRREAERLCGMWNGMWMHHLNADDVAALVAADRLRDLTHTWTKADGLKPKDPPVVPTPRQVNEWSLVGFGHDSTNAWICAKAECERLGYDYVCERCDGEASLWPTPEIKQQADDWKSTEPPAGEGWQLWETVSDGSPISPVFATPEKLADWLATSPDYGWRKNDEGTTREQWLKFITGPGWAPTLISCDGKLTTGVQAEI